jgi:hypothetical protein
VLLAMASLVSAATADETSSGWRAAGVPTGGCAAPSEPATTQCVAATQIASTTQVASTTQIAGTTPGVDMPALRWLPYQPRESQAAEPVVPVAATALASFERPLVDDVPDAPPPAPNTSERPPGAFPEGMFTRKAVRPGDAAPHAGPEPVGTQWRAASIDEPREPAAPKTFQSPYLPPEERLPVLPAPEEECRRPRSRQMAEITADIRPKVKPGKVTTPPDCPRETASFQPRAWSPLTVAWTAPATCNKPLYFDEPQLENYGHTCGPYLQPILSSVHFFATVPLLPYYMGVTPPNECVYTLGYYRPGNCAPYTLDPFPLSVRGALFEGAFWTGLPFIF